MNYHELIDGPGFDIALGHFVRYLTPFIFLDLSYSWNLSVIVPYISMWIRGQIRSWIFRQFIFITSLLWLIWIHAWVSLTFLVALESVRYQLKYLLPILLRRRIPVRDAAVETMINRIVLALSSPFHKAIPEIMTAIYGYSKGENTEPFTDDEWSHFQLMYDLNQTFYYDGVVYSPFVIARYDQRPYLHFMDKYEVNRNPDQNGVCSICRENFPMITLSPKCIHEFCPKCILIWNVGNPNCPNCPAEENLDNTVPPLVDVPYESDDDTDSDDDSITHELKAYLEDPVEIPQ